MELSDKDDDLKQEIEREWKLTKTWEAKRDQAYEESEKDVTHDRVIEWLDRAHFCSDMMAACLTKVRELEGQRVILRRQAL
jgi:hypothetical protein